VSTGRKLSPEQSVRVPGWLPAVIPASLLVIAFLMATTYEMYIGASFRPDGAVTSSPSNGTVPREVLDGGPFIDTTGGQPVSYDLPPNTIVLTFDDGPSPEWTPQILSVLAKNGVPGTVFVIGSEVARYPDVMRDLVAGGNEVGVHTFTHPDETTLTPWMRSLEYSQTQLALAAVVGETTPLLRMPYSSDAGSINDSTWPLVQEAGRNGSWKCWGACQRSLGRSGPSGGRRCGTSVDTTPAHLPKTPT
jgi:hypothetical protein